jgi:hypothetical protein
MTFFRQLQVLLCPSPYIARSIPANESSLEGLPFRRDRTMTTILEMRFTKGGAGAICHLPAALSIAETEIVRPAEISRIPLRARKSNPRSRPRRRTAGDGRASMACMKPRSEP